MCSPQRFRHLTPDLYSLVFVALVSCLLSLSAFAAVAVEPPTYTAQRKPRVTVMTFADTNTDAGLERFGPSVSAMLVTYLKRNSQFVVVERQDIKDVLDEWRRNQSGQTNLRLDRAKAELLERIDVILAGKVTVLTTTDKKNLESRVEIDAKLLSRTDGRIITAVRRGGPKACLRQVVERLGAALQHDFLRPYYGKLQITLDAPEYTHFHLTPVLRDDALDEEKPPVELGATTYPGTHRDTVRHWITNPTTFTIDNILSGWYTLRLERDGYRGLEVDNSRFQAVEAGGTVRILYREGKGWTPIQRIEGNPEWLKFLVEVQPLTQEALNATDEGFTLHKQQGSLQFEVLDEHSKPLPQARIYLRNLDLEINPDRPGDGMDKSLFEGRLASRETANSEEALARSGHSGPSSPPSPGPNSSGTVNPAHPPGNNRCEFLVEADVPTPDSSEGRVVRTAQSFNLDTFQGGSLVFQSYQGERLPSGKYEVVIWAPDHVPVRRTLHVGDNIEAERQEVRLERRTRPVLIRGKSDSEVRFLGRATHYTQRVTPNRLSGIQRIALPVDHYQVSAELERFGSWSRSLDLIPRKKTAPALAEVFPSRQPSDLPTGEPLPPIEIPLKDQLWIGGRTAGFLPVPNVYYDERVEKILDRVLSISHARRQLSLFLGEKSDLELLEERLEEIDLLVLDEVDMARLRVLPGAANVIRRFVERGHALLAFVTEEGNYRNVFGAPLTVRKRRGSSKKVRLRPGQVSGFTLDKTIHLGARRAVPRIRHQKHRVPGWQVLAYAKKSGKRPRLLERRLPDSGGYVMVWLESSDTRALHDAPEAVRKALLQRIGGFFGLGAWKGGALRDSSAYKAAKAAVKNAVGDTAEVTEDTLEMAEELERHRLHKKQNRKRLLAWSKAEEANDQLLLLKAQIQNRALNWAEYLMYQRLGGEAEKLEKARARLATSHRRPASK